MLGQLLMLNLLIYHWPEQVACFIRNSLFMGKIAKHHGRNDDYRKWGRDKDLVRKGQRLVINNSAHICDKNQIKTESHLIKKTTWCRENVLQNIKLGDYIISTNLSTRFMIQETRVRLCCRLNMGTMTPH